MSNGFPKFLRAAPVTEPPTAELPAYVPARLGAAATARRLLERERIVRPLLIALFAGMVACTAVIVIDGSAGHGGVIPRQPKIAHYLSGLGQKLSYDTFLIAILAMVACYTGVVLLARAIPPRWAIAGIVLLHAMVLAGPVLLSQDVFSYLGYARLGALHGVNPYLHGPGAASHDPIYTYVGITWKHVPTAYGPLFTVLSYPLVWLGVNGSLWAMKLLAAAASLGTVWLVWLCARRLGRDPVVPAVILGLNPVLLIYGVGGAHNDLIMALGMIAGVWLVLRERDARGAGAVIAGAAVKATAVAVLPFMFLGRRRLGLIGGTAIGLALFTLVAYVGFGTHALDFVSTLKRQQSFVSTDSFPNEVAHLFGLPGVFPIDRQLLRVALALIVLYLMLRVWRGYDWIAGAGWTMLAIAVTTTWLLAWYTLWALPLAVLARDRRLVWATLAVQLLFVIHQTTPLFSPTL